VREGLLAAGVDLARTGGPDAVVLREATRVVGVAPNAAYRHFADRDELLAAVCDEAMRQLAARMAAGVAAVPGERGEPSAARQRLGAIGAAYLAFAREEPGLFATAFAVPRHLDYAESDSATESERTPLDHLRAQLDELVEAGVIDASRRPGLEFPIWSGVHGLAVLTGQGPLRALPEETRTHLAELLFAFVDRALR
jgi:AcrR family transcriptional regulator